VEGVSPSPADYGGLGERHELPPAVSGAEPRPKTNLVHYRAVIKPLVAIILSVLSACFTLHTGSTTSTN